MIPAVLFAVLAAPADVFPFRLAEPAELVAQLEMQAPAEAAFAALTLDGAARQQVALYAGPSPHRYSIFLGPVGAGTHQLRIQGARVGGVRFDEYRSGDPYYPILANAPILFAREDSAGRFTDVPLLAYCERLEEAGRLFLQYTVIFSNEDGGTSTRALMARWGRTTDIEYVYRLFLDAGREATIQAKDHKEIPFDGAREAAHPLLYVSTRNNMVSAEGRPAARYQLAPKLVDLSARSRESVMDETPETWRAMALELQREGKVRPFNKVDGENISDPRNYLYLELKVGNRDSAVAALVRLRSERLWRSSNLGRTDYAISRDGWVRTTVELPPGAKPADIAELAFQCLVLPAEVKGKLVWPEAGLCRVEALRRAFLLDSAWRPGLDVIEPFSTALEIPSGEIRLAYPR